MSFFQTWQTWFSLLALAALVGIVAVVSLRPTKEHTPKGHFDNHIYTKPAFKITGVVILIIFVSLFLI